MSPKMPAKCSILFQKTQLLKKGQKLSNKAKLNLVKTNLGMGSLGRNGFGNSAPPRKEKQQQIR